MSSFPYVTYEQNDNHNKNGCELTKLELQLVDPRIRKFCF